MKNYLEGHLQLDEVHLTPNFDVLILWRNTVSGGL